RNLGIGLRAGGDEGGVVGDEGGYGPKLNSNVDALKCVVQAIERAGLRPGEDVQGAIDVASSPFYGTRVLPGEGDVEWPLRSDQMIGLFEEWVDQYPNVSIEDGLAEEDWPGWKLLTQRLGERVQLIGDDLFVTQTKRIEQGIAAKVANSVLIKP